MKLQHCTECNFICVYWLPLSHLSEADMPLYFYFLLHLTLTVSSLLTGSSPTHLLVLGGWDASRWWNSKSDEKYLSVLRSVELWSPDEDQPQCNLPPLSRPMKEPTVTFSIISFFRFEEFQVNLVDGKVFACNLKSCDLLTINGSTSGISTLQSRTDGQKLILLRFCAEIEIQLKTLIFAIQQVGSSIQALSLKVESSSLVVLTLAIPPSWFQFSILIWSKCEHNLQLTDWDSSPSFDLDPERYLHCSIQVALR